MRALYIGLALAFAAVGCNPDKVLQAANTGSTTATPTVTASAAPVATAPPPAIGKMDFAENDFVESDRNRDPFRSFASVFAPEPTKKLRTGPQLTVLLAQYSLDELKLVAIVTGGDFPRAMVVDPNGKGWVLKRGDWVGRSEIVHTGGANGADYQLNWRVDKVRDGDVVFTREDPANAAVPPSSRVITLHPESESKNQASLTD
jgi:type IV pilus assembly protein PilP